MTAMPAFGSEARKQALLDDLRAQGPFFAECLSHASVETDITETVKAQNLHPALVRLLGILGQYGMDEEGRAFQIAALDALPVGADPLQAIRCWFLALWSHPAYSLAATLEGTDMLDPAEAIIALVKQSRAEPVDRQTWRKARSALIAAMEAPAVEKETNDDEASQNETASLADPILSMAWDLEQTPGAASDVANASGGRIFWNAHAHDHDQFTETESEALMASYRQFHEQAVESIGELTPGDAEQYAAYQTALDGLWAKAPEAQALKTRSDERQERVKAISAAWRQAARNALLDCIKTPSASTAA
ncbi:hypothetical protein D3C71_182260 [compost metagenome]